MAQSLYLVGTAMNAPHLPTPRQPRSRLYALWGRLKMGLQRKAAYRHVAASMRRVHGPAMTRLKDDQVALILVGRDVGYFIDHHIRHHLALGVTHIVYVDNGSSDDSIEIAKRFPNITIATCSAMFRLHQAQIRHMANTRFLQGGWRLAIDPDELLDYPGADRISLPELTRRMSARGHTALVAQMLDMVHDGPVTDTIGLDFCTAEAAFDRFSLRDISEKPYDSAFLREFLGLNSVTNPDIAFLFGGIRHRAFGENCCLTKHALFRMDKNVVPHPHPHVTTGITCTDFSALLRHYKFAGNILAREQKLLAENRISHGEMRQRMARIARETDINLGTYAEFSHPTPEGLIEKGFLKASPEALKMLA